MSVDVVMSGRFASTRIVKIELGRYSKYGGGAGVG